MCVRVCVCIYRSYEKGMTQHCVDLPCCCNKRLQPLQEWVACDFR